MFKTSTLRAASIRTSFTFALLGGMMMFGGCGDFDAAGAAQTASAQQALEPQSPGADVWRANLGVTIAATKDSVAKKITYVFEATNHGDDDARQVLLTAYLPPGVTVSTSSPSGFDSCSAVATVGNGSSYIQCSLSSLGVRAKVRLTVTVSNPTNATSQASAQVHNLSPDPIVTNNYAQLWVY